MDQQIYPKISLEWQYGKGLGRHQKCLSESEYDQGIDIKMGRVDDFQLLTTVIKVERKLIEMIETTANASLPHRE